MILRVKDKKWPAEYVFRQLKSPAMKLFIQRNTTGSTIPSLKIGILKDLLLVSPTKESVKIQSEKHAKQIEKFKKIKELQREINELEIF